MAVYVVVSNFFIQAHRSSYPLDIAFSFWEKVKKLALAGKIISIDKVRNELFDNNDELEDWCRSNLPDNFFKSTINVMDYYRRVVEWAVSMREHYKPMALNEFLDAHVADAFLVAYSLEDNENRTIVTQEISQPGRKNKIKIPDACLALDVKFLNSIEMFRELGEIF